MCLSPQVTDKLVAVLFKINVDFMVRLAQWLGNRLLSCVLRVHSGTEQIFVWPTSMEKKNVASDYHLLWLLSTDNAFDILET